MVSLVVQLAECCALDAARVCGASERVLSGCIVYFRFFTSTNVQTRTPEELHTQLAECCEQQAARVCEVERVLRCSVYSLSGTKVHILTCEGERVLSDASAMSFDVAALRRGALDKLDALHAMLCGTQFTCFTGTKSPCFTR